jgi:ankyrin repeat protein/predicted nucleotidyltransferase
MSNNNQIPVNIGNIPMQTNAINPLNQMNLVFLNNNLANLNLQNNIQMNQMNQNLIFNKIIMSMDNFDYYTFENLVSQNQFNSQTKNILLNKAIFLYLTHFSQAKAQYALKQMITILLKLKANPNLRLRYSNNQNNVNNNNFAIFQIVEKNDIELVKVFLDNNADINVFDNQGRNCLFYLMINPNNSGNLIDKKPLCSLLLGKGIKINYLDNNGISPIIESIIKGYDYIMNMFIKYGGDTNLVNFNDGNTALHYAIKHKRMEALYTLLGKGNCDLYIKNKNGETPIDLAKKLTNESNKEIYELIMKYAGVGKENNDDDNDKSISNNDKMFVFLKGDISSRVEIPFSFQDNPIYNNTDNDSINSDTTTSTHHNQFHSFIKIQNPPTLYLDISNETSKEQLMYDGLQTEVQELEKTLDSKQDKLQRLKIENDSLKNELKKLQNELIQKKNIINILTEQIKQEDNAYIQKMQMSQTQIEQKDRAIQSLLIQYKNLENEIKNDKKTKNNDKQNTEKIDEKNESEKGNLVADNKQLRYLEKKFDDEKYSDNEVINLLTTDLYDLYHYNNIIYESRIQEINKMINILKEIIDINVDIKLYGSYATKTSLSWSEVDILIIPNNNPNYINDNFYMNFIQNLFHKLKNGFYGKVFYLEDTHIITPIIKVEVNENNITLIYNIYVFDNINYGDDLKNINDNSLLNSVIMTNEYNNKYKGKFIPLLLGLKEILYNANLINNYYNNMNLEGISSYALNVMLMSFLDHYACHTNEIPLGQIFMDFLKINGYLNHENNNKKVIYLDYNNNGHNEKNEEIKFYSENATNLDSLIIIDPFNIRNNLCVAGDKIYGYSQIKTALMISYCVIKDNCECSCHYDESIGYQGKTHCILNKILKTIKRVYNKRKNQ